ncbi:MFS transporter [Amnibacterium sp. CER49]|uniref:MFS transporter n=1 Tax=Amnibacterium sp. CER49 TaxID=3039161 RepID=UPI002446A633|nr:MFS transporter [Amnibacterium sp. CER49]MDH2443615.1 MFS transporter [Amnibacterium sp. CER49]
MGWARRGTTAPAPELIRWRNAVFTIFGLTGLAFATWASRVPGIRDLLSASTQEMGFLLLGISIGSISGLLGASHIVARLGATRTILVCYTAASVALLALGAVTAFAPSFGAFFVPLAVFGAGSSIVDVAMNLSGAANERAIGRTLMPLYHAAFSLGTVVGAGIGSALAAFGVPIAAHFAGVGLIALVTTLALVRHLQPAEDPEHAEHGATWQSRLAVWRDGRVLLIGLIVLGMAFAEGSANDWLSLAMVDGHGVTNAAGAAIFGVFVAAMTVGRVAGAGLLDRFGRVPVLRVSAGFAVLGLLLVIVVPNVVVAVVGVVLWGLGAALGFPVGMSAAADDPRTANAAVSAVATIGYLAFLVGPPLIGLLGQRFTLLLALLVVLVLIAVGGLCSPAARRPGAAAAPAA